MHLAAADVMVFPSLTDTFGLVNLEAMACGVPVAAYPVTGPIDVVEDGVTGALDRSISPRLRAVRSMWTPQACRERALKSGWDVCSREFEGNLERCESLPQPKLILASRLVRESALDSASSSSIRPSRTEIVERAVETQHAALRAGAYRLLHADDIALLDEFRDVRGVHHDLGGRDPQAAFRRNQALRKNGAQILREVQKYLIVLVARKHVDDAIERFGAIIGMQRRDAQMSRAGERDRRLHGFTIANFADQYHIGRGAHGAAQRARKCLGVEAHFPLIDDGFLVGVQELDRVLNGQDMIGRGFVAVIDHCRERRGLAGAGGADHQNQAALQHHQLFEDLRHAEIFEPGHLRGDIAQHHGRVAALIEHVHAKAAEARLRKSRNRSPILR